MNTETDRYMGEHGSLPLAMLATIVVAGVITVLVSSVIASRESTRTDRDFTQAVHVADAGIQSAMLYLNQNGTLPATLTDTVDGQTFDVSTSFDATSEVWEVTSTSTVDGVDRKLVVTAGEVPLFSHALYAKQGIAFSGANSTDSYDRDTSTWCTGNGRTGTDGAFTFSGLAPTGSCHSSYNKVTVDHAILYDCGDQDDQTCRDSTTSDGTSPRCTHSGGQNCDLQSTNPQSPLTFESDPFRITPESEVRRIQDEAAYCENTVGWDDELADVSASPGVWITDNGDTIPPQTSDPNRDYWCVSSLVFGGDTTLAGADIDTPVRIYVEGGAVEVRGSKTKVNCPGCTHTDYRATYPDAAALSIYSLGADNFKLADPQIMIAATVYTPNAICDGPAGADIFGAIICDRVDNVGNWNFHYDDRLQFAGGTDVFGITSYREELD